MRGIWITGTGIVCSAGLDPETAWAAMDTGTTAIARARRFRVPAGRNDWVAHADIATELTLDETLSDAGARLCLTMARRAAADALEHAGEHTDETETETALVWASNVEDVHLRMHELAARIADELGLGGPRLGVSVACASATLALVVGARLIAGGLARRVLVVAADVITPRVIAGFEVLGLLADGPCVPFSPRVGTSLGEAAAAVVLDAERPRAGPALRIAGWGSSNDAHHPTQPHPGGLGVAQALRAALARAGCPAASIEHVIAHGTGTAANDGAEWQGLSLALDGRAVPVSSLKALVGHTQGACGLVDLVLGSIAMRHGSHPPTVGFDLRRPGAPPDVVGPRPRPGSPGTFACSSSGFGGANAALVVTRDETGLDLDRPVPAPTYVLGLGQLDEARAARLDPRRAVRGVDLRGLDPWAQALTVALSDALADAGQRPSRRELTGLFVGQAQVSLAQARRLGHEYADAGLYGASANTFTQTFLGYPASAAAASLGLRGPFGVSTEGRCAGLVALVHACELLREHAARSMMAGEVDGGPALASAVGLALGVAPRPQAQRAVRVLAYALGPHDAPERAQAEALGRAGWERTKLDASFELGSGLGLGVVARACEALRRGELTRALVWGREAGALACAILFEADAH